MFQMDLISRAATHLAKLKSFGYDVIATDSFSEVESLVAQTGKPFRSPMFDLRRNDFVQGRAFWLFLVRDGKVLGGLAAKSLPLGQETFEAYMRRVSGNQFDAEAPLASIAPPVLERLCGHLVYFGELHFSPEGRGRRSVLREYSRLAVVLAAMSWPDFDWMYATIPFEQRSLQDLYGFPIITHAAFKWREPVPYLHKNSHAMIYMSKLDFVHSLTVAEPDQAAKN